MADLLTQLKAEYEQQRQRRRRSTTDERDAETTIGGTTVALEASETIQTSEDVALLSSDVRGVPRSREAIEARELTRTEPMQLVLNSIVDQLLGGELAFPSDDEERDGAEAELVALVEDVVRGPHLGQADFDDLLAAAVADMVAVGNAYLETISPAGEADVPVAALKPVDPLTVRHNVDETGTPENPPYFQAPFRTQSGAFAAVGSVEVTELEAEDLVVMSYPGSYRSDRVYPLSPAMQLRDWLEVILDSTTHLGRYYRDDELPPGVLTAIDATDSDIEAIKDELQAAKGDPRSAPVVGTDTRWVEVGGSAVDLSHIEEQEWFLKLTAAAFGVPKQELGLVEDVNRNTAEAQLSTIHKRVTQPIAETVGEALTRQLLPQFSLYRDLDAPFRVDLRFSDPVQERAQEEHAREQYQAGALPYREYREAVGDDMSDVDTTVEINGQTIDYGEYPKHVVEALLIDARNDDPPGQETSLEE